MSRRLLGRALRLLPLALVVIAILALQRMARHLDWAGVRAALTALDGLRAGAAALAVAAGYAALVTIDALACRAVGARPRWSQVVTVGLIGHALTHSLGNAALVGGAVRSRYYALWGLPPGAVVRVIASTACAPVLGACLLAGVLGLSGGGHASLRALPAAAWAVALLPPLAYLAWAASRRPLAWRRWRLAPPPPRLALAQLALGAVEAAARTLVLACVLPATAGIATGTLLLAFIPALIAGKLSQVPGGLGVVEGCVLALVAPAARPAALGALALYRALYDAAPLVVAVLSAGVVEVLVRVLPRAPIGPLRLPGWLLRSLLGAAGTLAGVVACLAAVAPWTPAAAPGWPARGAQLVLGLSGIALLWASRAVERRLAGGWWLTLLAAVAGAGAGWIAGAPLATGLAVLAGAVTAAGARECPRRGSLAYARTPRTWMLLSICLVVGGGAITVVVPTVPGRLPGVEVVAVEALAALALLAWRLLAPTPSALPEVSAAAAARWRQLLQLARAAEVRLPAPTDRLLLAEAGRAGLWAVPPASSAQPWLLLPVVAGPADVPAVQALAWQARDSLTAHAASGLVLEDEARVIARELGLSAAPCGERARLALPLPAPVAATAAARMVGAATADPLAVAALAQARREGRDAALLTLPAGAASAWAVLDRAHPVAAVVAAGGPAGREGVLAAVALLRALAHQAAQAGAQVLALGFHPAAGMAPVLSASGWFAHPAGVASATLVGARVERLWASRLGGGGAAALPHPSIRLSAWSQRQPAP